MTSVVGDVLVELVEITFEARSTAEEMHKFNGPDLIFLDCIPENKKLYAADLTKLGISHTVLGTTGWLRQQNLAWSDHGALTKQGIKPANPIFYTDTNGLIAYCVRNFSEVYLVVIHRDQFGKGYYLKDL